MDALTPARFRRIASAAAACVVLAWVVRHVVSRAAAPGDETRQVDRPASTGNEAKQARLSSTAIPVAPVLDFKAHRDFVSAVAFTPDGRWLLSSGYDSQIRWWDPATGRCLGALRASAPVLSMAVSPDGKLVAFSGDDKSIQLWRMGTHITRVGSVIDDDACVAFSSDGRLLACGSSEGRVTVRQVPTLGTVASLTGLSLVFEACFARTGAYIGFAGTTSGKSNPDANVGVWDYRQEKLAWSHAGEPADTTSLSAAFSPSGDLFLTGGYDGVVKVWRSITGELVRSIPVWQSDADALAFLHDGKFLACASRCGIAILQMPRGDVVWRWSPQNPEDSLAFSNLAVSQDESLLAVGFTDGNVRIWQIESLE